MSSFEPALLQKPWSSFIEKTYRKNIVENIAFPNPPPAGWCLPPEWYSQIHDIIRTTVVVKYIDGVPLVLKHLERIATGTNLVCEADLETREDGYYGAHFSLEKKCQISTMDWSKETRDVRLEIQVTTQIKDVIKNLLHTYYESPRNTGVKPRLSDIAWSYREEEFVATYLGHILHYVEGMIIEVRDRRRGRDA